MTLEARGGTVWSRARRTKYNMESDPAEMVKEAAEILEAAEFVRKMQSNPQAVAEYEDYMKNVVMPYAYKQYTAWRDTSVFDYKTFVAKYPSSGTVRSEVDQARRKLERQAILVKPSPKE